MVLSDYRNPIEHKWVFDRISLFYTMLVDLYVLDK